MKRCFLILLLCLLVLGSATALTPQAGIKTTTGAAAAQKQTPVTAKPKKKNSHPSPPARTSPKKSSPKAPRNTSNAGDPAVGKTASGKAVYEGSRGGFYYLTDAGTKIYVQDFVGAKIIGKTPDGKNIFEGPRGGRFYYNDAGDKVYQKQ